MKLLPPFAVRLLHSTRWPHVAALLFAALTLPFLEAQAQFGPVMPRPLNTNASTDGGGDFSPVAASDNAGVWVSVWSSRENLNGTAGTDADIFVARSLNGGQTWSAPALLNSNANSDTANDLTPFISTDRHGRWLAAWHSAENLGGTNGVEGDILFSISTDGGQTWSPLRSLNVDAAIDSRSDAEVCLENNAAGNWVAAWHGVGGGAFGFDQDIWTARSSDGGESWSAPVPLNNNAGSDAGSDFNVSLSTDRQGAWLAVWSTTDDLAGPSDSDGDLALARSFDQGATWSAPVFLTSNAGSDSGEDFNPNVLTDRRGAWLVVWESGDSLGGTIGSDQDLLFVRSTDNGNTWSSPAALNASAFTDSALDSFPSIATDAAGVWVVAWNSDNRFDGGLGADQDILAAYSVDQGRTWSPPQPVAGNTGNDSGEDTQPCLVSDENGTWVLAWGSSDSLNGTIGTEGDILTTSIVRPLLWPHPEPLNSNAAADVGNDFGPRIATDGAGNWVSVWVSSENLNGTAGPDFDILYSRSTNNGVTWSAPALLNSNGNSDAGADRDPYVVSDTKGRWVAVWGSTENLNGQLGTDGDILFAISTNKGLTWSPPAALNSTATNDTVGDFTPRIATDGKGAWVATWGTSGAYGGDFDLVRAWSTNNAISWSAAEPLNSNAVTDDGDDFDPRVATDAQGRWIAVWMSNSRLTGLGYDLGSDDDILVAYSANNGASWSSPRPLNNNAATDGPDDDDYSPRLGTDGTGTWITVWPSEGTLGGLLATNKNILYSRSANHGASWSSPAALNTTATFDDGDDDSPEIAVDASGRWLVAWNTRARSLGGDPGTFAEDDIALSTSNDGGVHWSPPAALNTDGFVDDRSDINPHLAAGGGSTWIAVWSSQTNLLGADFDIQVARTFLPSFNRAQVPPLTILNAQVSPPPGIANFTLTWTGGLPPFQVQVRTNLSTGGWSNAGGPTCDRTAVFPIAASSSFFRILSLGDNTQPQLEWLEPVMYFQGAMNAVANTVYVDGFGIDDTVDVLISGALPITVERTLLNSSLFPVAAGYTVEAQLQGWTFLAVGGTAAYVPGALPFQQMFDCQTTNTPALAPGQSAVISFTLGGASCPPSLPVIALPCGLYQETMTVQASTVVAGFCTNTIDIVADNYVFVDEPNRIVITSTLNPGNDPNITIAPVRNAWVFAVPNAPVQTHQINITTTMPGLTYFVRARSPIFGLQAPTQGDFIPAIPQAPAPPLQVTGNSAFGYWVTVIPAYNGSPTCNVIGLPSFYQETVNTTITAISTNGCAIAQESILATGIYECNF